VARVPGLKDELTERELAVASEPADLLEAARG
jgi:hypothetical protein